MSGKTPNHQLSSMRCPVNLDDVDLFSPGAQEHWYEAYDILHQQAPVHRLPGEGFMPGTDGYILTKHEDIELVVKNWERFPPIMSVGAEELAKQDTGLALGSSLAVFGSRLLVAGHDGTLYLIEKP